MQRATIAEFINCCWSKDKPIYGQCPAGAGSWYKCQQSLALVKTYKDASVSLHKEIINLVKPIYMKLCDQKLLEKSSRKKMLMKALMPFWGQNY